MSSTYSVIRRAARSTEDRSTAAGVKSNNDKPLTIQALTKSINGVEDRSSRKRLAALQRQAIASGGAYTQVERDMINRLVRAVKDGGNLELALAAEVIDVVGDLAKRNPKGELYENQREIAFLLLDAIGSSKYDDKRLKPIIDEFRRLSSDDNGFTEKDAQRIRDLLRNLDMLDEAGEGGGRPGGSYGAISDVVDTGRPERLVPDKPDLGDIRIKLPKDGGKGQGGAGGEDDKDEGGKDTRGIDDKGRDPKGKDPEGKDTRGADDRGRDPEGKDTKGTDGKGRDGADGKDDKEEGGKGTDGEAKPKPGDVAVAIGVIQGLAGGADNKDDKDKDGKDDATGTDGKGRDPKGKDSEGKDTDGKDDKGKDDKGQDTTGQDPDGTGAKGKDGKDTNGKGEDGRFEGPDGPPTDIKRPRNVIDGKFPEGTRGQDPQEDPKNPVNSEPDDVKGGKEGKVKDPTDPTDPNSTGPDKTEDPKKTAGADKDGRPATVSGSVSAAAVLLRTPFPVVMKQTTPLEMTAQEKVIALANPKGAGQLFFKFEMGGDGNFDLYQSRNGKDGWVIVSKGWSGDAQVQYGTTYELTTGGIGTVGVSTGNQDDPLAGSGAAGYAQFKWIDTFRVQNRDWDKLGAKKRQRQFRVRLIAQVTAQGGFRTEEGQEKPRVATVGDLRVEYRWGRTSKVASPDGKNSDGIPDSFNQWEVGVGLGLGVAIDFVALGKAAEAGDVNKLKDIAATVPRGAVTVQFWLTGLQKLKAWTLDMAQKLVNKKNNRFTKTVGNILQKFGAFFQSYVVSAFAAVGVRGNNPNTAEGQGAGLTAITVANQIGTPSTSAAGSQGSDADAGLPSQEELEGMADGLLEDVKGLFDWLEQSGLADLAKKAAPIIETVSALAAVKKMASKKGLIDFAIDQLAPEERGRMTDLVMSRAFELALEASGAPPDPTTGKGLDASKGFMKIPGESIAEYGARIIKLVMAKIPEAAKDVLLDEASWDDILIDVKNGGGSGSSGGGGPIAGGGDPTAGGKGAAIGAAIGAGLGLGGLLAGLGKNDDNKDDKDDKDVDKPTATGGPGGSRNAALNAVHEADEAQGDRLPVTVEAEASIYITPKLAADPVYMAAYVARLSHDQDDVAAARKYAATMSDLGDSKDAARVLAHQLTNAEIADPAFMKTLGADLAGIERQPSDIDGVIYETQVKAVLEALRGKQPADPSVEPIDKGPASKESRRELADRVIRLGSENGVWVNRSELEKGLEAAGLKVKAPDEAWERVISTYGAAGTGVLTAAELADAMEDGVIKITQDGAVTVDARALQEQQRPNSQNVALRVITSLGIDALTTVAQLREGFRNAGYELTATDAQLEEFLRLFNHGQGIDHNALTGAIAVAALKIVGADGRVTVDQAVLDLLKPPPRRPGSIEDPRVGQAGPGSIVIDGEPA